MAVRPRRLSPSNRIRLQRWLFAAGVFGLWELVGHLDNPVVFPPVSQVAVALYRVTVYGALIPALAQSLELLAIGFATAMVAGFLFGLLLGRYKVVDRAVSPYVYALYATPMIALVPLVVVWFGFGLGGRVVVVFLAAFFPILINIYSGVRDTPSSLVEVARSFGVRSEIGMMRRIVIPAAIPYIMAGIRLGIGRAVVGMAVAEVFLRLGGIGSLIVQYGAAFRTDYVFATILPLPLLGIGLTKLVAMIEGRYQSWRVS